VKICANDDERANGVVVPNTPNKVDPLFILNKTLFEGCVDDTANNPFHNFQRQHAPNDRPEFPTAANVGGFGARPSCPIVAAITLAIFAT